VREASALAYTGGAPAARPAWPGYGYRGGIRSSEGAPAPSQPAKLGAARGDRS